MRWKRSGLICRLRFAASWIRCRPKNPISGGVPAAYSCGGFIMSKLSIARNVARGNVALGLRRHGTAQRSAVVRRAAVGGGDARLGRGAEKADVLLVVAGIVAMLRGRRYRLV